MTRKAVYAGSFDPVTRGHEWMIRTGAHLFDELTVAVGVNPDKDGHFPVTERLGLLRDVCSGLGNVEVTSFENRYLVHFAEQTGAHFILRGIRSESDYDYERTMRHINADLAPRVTTVFLMPPRDLAEISSSMVMGLVGVEGWRDVVKPMVPEPVHEALLRRRADD